MNAVEHSSLGSVRSVDRYELDPQQAFNGNLRRISRRQIEAPLAGAIGHEGPNDTPRARIAKHQKKELPPRL